MGGHASFIQNCLNLCHSKFYFVLIECMLRNRPQTFLGELVRIG